MNIMRQDLEMIEQKLKTLINLLAELQIENKLLKEKTSQQDESIKQLNTKIHEASQKIENLLGQIPDEELLLVKLSKLMFWVVIFRSTARMAKRKP